MTAAALPDRDDVMPVTVRINGEQLVADVSGALWLPERRALLVADLHLEKGSSFARSGQLVPPYDTVATLSRLGAVAARLNPSTLFVLGDAFHDPFAGERMASETLATIAALSRGRTLVWIAGNHDPRPPAGVPGDREREVRLGGLILRHVPARSPGSGEIAGHLHPVARVLTRATTVRRRCFIHDERRAILPAFGAYAGGLSVRNPAIADLFDTPRIHVLGEKRVLSIAPERVV